MPRIIGLAPRFFIAPSVLAMMLPLAGCAASGMSADGPGEGASGNGSAGASGRAGAGGGAGAKATKGGAGGTNGTAGGGGKSGGAAAGGSSVGGAAGTTTVGGAGGKAAAGAAGKGGAIGCGPEICDNGADDDCDGVVDEDCACVPGATAACFRGLFSQRGNGICKDGLMQCTGSAEFGTWCACEGDSLPTAEVCDEASVDENCNGTGNEQCECAAGSAPLPGIRHRPSTS